MASTDLEQFFKDIRNASNGEAVRDAIIYAAKNLRTSANNSQTLGGVEYTKFATRSSYDTLVTALYDKINYDVLDALEDDAYALKSENVMSSGNMFDILSLYLRPALSTIMHYEYDPLTDKTTKEAVKTYLKYLKEAKDGMYKSILAKTKMHWTNHSFRDFADIIEHIDDDVPELEKNVEFTKDGTYDAGEFSVNYRAYEDIKVNVPDDEIKVQGSTSENNSVHIPPSGKLYSSFNVNIANASAARSSTVKGRTGGSGSADVDENGLLEVKEITENGTYSASGDSVSGYKSVSVHVQEPEASGEFTVRFLNGDDELDSLVVPAYGSAYYTGETPVNPNESDDRTVFNGWDPVPFRVTRNLDCQAQYKLPEENPDPAEITDSWEEIVSCRGRKYSIGDYKSLEIGSIGGTNYGTLIMQKVGDGVSNATSVWISKTVLALPTATYSWGPWPTCGVRRFLNGDFINILSALQDGELIANNVVPMELTTMAPWTDWPDGSITGEYYRTLCEYKTIDEFWVPSAFEMFGQHNLYNREKSGDLSYEAMIEIHMNYRRPYPNPEINSTLSTTSWSEPYNPNIYGYEWHTDNMADYSSAYGWTDVSLVNDNREIQITPRNQSKYQKHLSTNLSREVDYTLRTIRTYTTPNASTTLIHNYWRVTNTGAIGHGATSGGYPIGFGL